MHIKSLVERAFREYGSITNEDILERRRSVHLEVVQQLQVGDCTIEKSLSMCIFDFDLTCSELRETLVFVHFFIALHFSLYLFSLLSLMDDSPSFLVFDFFFSIIFSKWSSDFTYCPCSFSHDPRILLVEPPCGVLQMKARCSQKRS